MTTRFFRNIVFPALVMAAIGGFIAVKADAESAVKGYTKAEIEKIVHDYITKDPQFILDAVDAYQKKTAAARSEEALKTNGDAVFKDPDSPEVGNPQGDVTMVEFFDYNCGYCKHAFPMIQSLLDKDKNLRIVFKELPILGPTSESAAKWALAAHKQKKYFEFHRILINNKAPITDDLLEKSAAEAGLDVEQAKKDVTGADILLQIEKNRGLADNLGLTGTPAFVIGDEIARGALPLEQMEKIITDQRQKSATKK